MREGAGIMQISEKHIEWAVVDRLQQMLEAAELSEFRVTQSFGLFTAIPCWTMQRIQTDGNGPADRSARTVLELLKKQKIKKLPWSYVDRTDPGVGELTADRFFVALRDACAHGDGRSVRPNNRQHGAKRVLVGFTFECRVAGRGRVTAITLAQGDFRRLGVGLAEMFCDALQRGDENFRRDAKEGVLEAADMGRDAVVRQ